MTMKQSNRVENHTGRAHQSGCVYIQAERMAKQSVEQGVITRFQVAEYLKEWYTQATGAELGDRFDPNQPKDFFRRWNGAKRTAIKEYKQYQARKAELGSIKVHLSDVAPVELLIAQEMRAVK